MKVSHRDPALLGGLYLLPLLLYLILGVSFLAAGFISLFRIRFFFVTSELFHVYFLPFCLSLSGSGHVHLYVTIRSVIKEQEGRAKIDKLEKLMVRID